MFKSQTCFDRHKQLNGKLICASLLKRSKCHKVIRRNQRDPEKHRCSMTKCPICGEYIQTDDHHCYMQLVRESDDVTENGYNRLLFFDFECRQENGNHEPNLCVVQNEAGDEWVFEGDNTWNEFCEWLFQKERVNSMVMVHNFQGYDSYFVLQFLRENGVKYDVIMRGAKVLSLTVPMCKIKFKMLELYSDAIG